MNEQAERPQILGHGVGEAIGLSVDREGHVAYVADLSGKIWAIPGPGHPRTELRIVVDVGFALTGLYFVP